MPTVIGVYRWGKASVFLDRESCFFKLGGIFPCFEFPQVSVLPTIVIILAILQRQFSKICSFFQFLIQLLYDLPGSILHTLSGLPDKDMGYFDGTRIRNPAIDFDQVVTQSGMDRSGYFPDWCSINRCFKFVKSRGELCSTVSQMPPISEN